MFMIRPISTEKLIEQYTYYLDGKVAISSEKVRLLEETLSRRSFKGICARKLDEIFKRCADYPNPFET